MERHDRCPKCHERLSQEFILKAATKELQSLWKEPGTRARIWDFIPANLGVAMAASITSRLRGNKKGASKKLRPCQYCGLEFGGREMRIHIPRCPKKPIFRQHSEPKSDPVPLIPKP